MSLHCVSNNTVFFLLESLLSVDVLVGGRDRPQGHLVEGDQGDAEEHAQATANLANKIVQLVQPGLADKLRGKQELCKCSIEQ